MYRIFTGIIIGILTFLFFLMRIVDSDTMLIVIAIEIYSVSDGIDGYRSKRK